MKVLILLYSTFADGERSSKKLEAAFLTENDANKASESLPHSAYSGHQFEKIVLYDDYFEFVKTQKNRLIQKALSKLTEEEKMVLDLCSICGRQGCTSSHK